MMGKAVDGADASRCASGRLVPIKNRREYDMKNFWSKLKPRIRQLTSQSFVDTIRELIKNTIKSIGDTSNVLIIILKLLWVLLLVIILSIVLLFKRLFRLIRRLVVITIQEINSYAALLAKISKNLRQRWNDVLIVFIDIQHYLLGKIQDDQTRFIRNYQASHWKLFLWDFPAINILWLIWFAISLAMGLLLLVSSVVLFPVLHMFIRLSFAPDTKNRQTIQSLPKDLN